MPKLNVAPLTRLLAWLSVLVLLGAGAATAGHLHTDEEVRHDCAACAAGFLTPFVEAQPTPSFSPADALASPPDPQGPPLRARYRAHLLSRAPPVPA